MANKRMERCSTPGAPPPAIKETSVKSPMRHHCKLSRRATLKTGSAEATVGDQVVEGGATLSESSHSRPGARGSGVSLTLPLSPFLWIPGWVLQQPEKPAHASTQDGSSGSSQRGSFLPLCPSDMTLRPVVPTPKGLWPQFSRAHGDLWQISSSSWDSWIQQDLPYF